MPGGLSGRTCAERSVWCLIVATDESVSVWWLADSENKPPFLSTVIFNLFQGSWINVFMLPPGCEEI